MGNISNYYRLQARNKQRMSQAVIRCHLLFMRPLSDLSVVLDNSLSLPLFLFLSDSPPPLLPFVSKYIIRRHHNTSMSLGDGRRYAQSILPPISNINIASSFFHSMKQMLFHKKKTERLKNPELKSGEMY